jgi:ELWxxDGT repeat protein
VNGTLFFNGQDPTDGSFQLWESDGSPTGTVDLTDVNPPGTPGSLGFNPQSLTDVNGTLYFTASDPTIALWEVPNTPPVANNTPFDAHQSTTLTVPASLGLLAYASAASYGGSYTAALVTGPGNGSMSLNLDGSFSYTPNPGFFGTDSFTYQVTDGELSSTPATVTINVLPGGLVSTSAFSLNATEFQPATGIVASYVDQGDNDPAADYTALVDWGDGASTQGNVVRWGTTLYVVGTHTYTRASIFHVGVTFFDADGSSASRGGGSVDVLDAPLQGRGQSLSFVEGASGGGVVATFRDADPAGQVGDYTATIDWGDGSNSAGTVTANGNGFAVNGTHTYAEERGSVTVPITVTITDFAFGQVVVSSSATVADAPLKASAIAVTAVPGKPFTGTVATFTDADPGGTAADYTATISWDNHTTSAGKILGSGPFTVIPAASHVFSPFTGTRHITVQISDAGSSQASVTDIVTDPPKPTPSEIYVFAAYQSLTGQPPAYASLMAWTQRLDQGALTRSQFVAQVEATPAYLGNIVQALYQAYLHKPADAAALAAGTQYLAHHSAEQLAQHLALPGFDSSTYRKQLLASYTAALPRSAAASTLQWALAAWQDGWTDNQVVAHVLTSPAYWAAVQKP